MLAAPATALEAAAASVPAAASAAPPAASVSVVASAVPAAASAQVAAPAAPAAASARVQLKRKDVHSNTKEATKKVRGCATDVACLTPDDDPYCESFRVKYGEGRACGKHQRWRHRWWMA